VAGTAAIVAGVAEHVRMYVSASDMDYMLVGMGWSASMLAAMVLVVAGVVLAGWSLLAPSGPARAAVDEPVRLQSITVTRAHLLLWAASIVALAIDVMKPATIGFVLPGLRDEYGISKGHASLLPLIALTGTAVGSLLWGSVADRYGRRPALLLAGLLFIATSICGAMPTFDGNLTMCWCMGLSAGGFLPVMLTLVAELAPRRWRGFAVVGVSGLGAAIGYLAASGLSTLLIPHYGWRIMWLIGLPSGLLLISLRGAIPESLRYLALTGRDDEAQDVVRRFQLVPAPALDVPARASAPRPGPTAKAPTLWSSRRENLGGLTIGLAVYGISWGLVNFGFLTWLPTLLGDRGSQEDIRRALAGAAVASLPGALAVAVLYQRWSAMGSLKVAALAVAAMLAAFCAVDASTTSATFVIALVVLLVALNGMSAILLPYAAEVYPTELRGRGTGLAAAGMKFGGIAGTLFVGIAVAQGLSLALIAVLLIGPVLAGLAWVSRTGVETRGRDLTDRLREPVAELAGGSDEAR
jgi:putative MFS transporter